MNRGKPWDDTESGRDARVAAAFGAELRAERKGIGWTQARVAEAAAVHAVTVSLIERGKRQPSLGVALRLSEALGLEPTSLVVRTSSRLSEES